ncbi:hypothetical protein M3Y97_00334800 [Aphelenchoides bicaudatus]|nr:hypothetical protein M3Y97_00334800 [Aphelenchoides bicaudatus]
MSVAHAVVANNRHNVPVLTLEPQKVDPASLLRPADLLINGKSIDFELASIDENASGKLIMKPLTEVHIQAKSVDLINDVEHQTHPTSSILQESGRRRKCSSEDERFVDDDLGVEFGLDAKHLNRVHEELEKLNIATDVINKLELELDHARDKFRQIQSECLKQSGEIQKKYESSIKKSRPYYDALREEQRLRNLAQQATLRFERANSMLQVAKQQVKLTQDSLERQVNVQPDCLEVLNHHVQRVNEVEQERLNSEIEHCHLSQQLIYCTQRVKQLYKENSRSIKKAKHYFDLHSDFKKKMDQQKALISKLEAEVKQKKRDYTSSLRNLEQISDSIHEERSLTSTKHSARTPDSTRKSVSAVGLSKLNSDLDEDSTDANKAPDSRRTTSSLNEGTGDSQSITSSSSGGISINQRNSSISDFCTEMPDTLTFDDYFDFKVGGESATTTSSSSHHGRSVSELSGLSDSSTTPAKKQLGSGVILLAQRLINGELKQEKDKPADNLFNYKHDGRNENDEIFYHTSPQGISPVDTPTNTAA